MHIICEYVKIFQCGSLSGRISVTIWRELPSNIDLSSILYSRKRRLKWEKSWINVGEYIHSDPRSIFLPRSRIIRVAVMHKKSAAPTFYSVPAKRQASSSSSSYGDVLTLQKWTLDRNLHLMELPEDVLYLLFRYLDLTSLGRLCQVCRKLRRLIQTDSVWLPFSRHQLVIREPQQGNLTKCRWVHKFKQKKNSSDNRSMCT